MATKELPHYEHLRLVGQAFQALVTKTEYIAHVALEPANTGMSFDCVSARARFILWNKEGKPKRAGILELPLEFRTFNSPTVVAQYLFEQLMSEAFISLECAEVLNFRYAFVVEAIA